jgi:16S rRNA (adenine1518-N6/adenine1519-N6)-dimethyltransferase
MRPPPLGDRVNEKPEPLRDVIARYGLHASRALGQNFILDRQLLARIAAIPGEIRGDTIYEVGPGPGGLTRALLDRGARVVAVERDRRFRPALDELAAEFPGQLQIVDADAMKVDESELAGTGARVVSNLPYNVGTALLLRWLTVPWPPWWRSLTLMFQKEVAERIVARPGTSAYGRLSVLAQWRSEARIAVNLSRSAFVPPPKVASAVVHIVPGKAPEAVDPKRIEKLTEAAFGQRRKMLRSSLKSVPGSLEALDRLGIDPQRRAETLEVRDFVALAKALSPSSERPSA